MTSKQGMTREEAHQLYDSMRKAMEAKYGKKGLAALISDDKKQKARQVKQAPAARGDAAASVAAQMNGAARRIARKSRTGGGGQRAAILLIVVFGAAKIALSALEASGFMTVQQADAAMIAESKRIMAQGPQYSAEELGILKSLDERRVDLEERSKKLEEREDDIERRDREFAGRLTQLRELTEKLKMDRAKSEKKRSSQLDQLAAVYGSMNPQEAAQLLEQLDVTISLSLIERMPEKRIGQILALMSAERALVLTQMLSKK